MDQNRWLEISRHPKFLELTQKRSRFGWFLTIVMVILYFGFICLVAFNKKFLARPLSDGVTTLSIPVGIGLIVVTVLLTGIYVRRANAEFDQLNDDVMKDTK